MLRPDLHTELNFELLNVNSDLYATKLPFLLLVNEVVDEAYQNVSPTMPLKIDFDSFMLSLAL